MHTLLNFNELRQHIHELIGGAHPHAVDNFTQDAIDFIINNKHVFHDGLDQITVLGKISRAVVKIGATHAIIVINGNKSIFPLSVVGKFSEAA